MIVTGFSGSARKDGNTALIMNIVLAEIEKQGIQTELIQFAGQTIFPCKGCFACRGKQNCIFQEDQFTYYFEKMVQANGILLGSPVYSADVSASMKAFLERAGVVVSTNPGLLKYKAAASVAAVRRAGGLSAVDTMNHFLLNKEVFVVGSTYWNMVYGKEPGDIYKDQEGVDNMRNLGQNIAFILQKLFERK